MGELIRVDNLIKQIYKRDRKRMLFKDISFAVNEGEFVTVIGEPFSGKSTLLQILAGMDREMEGAIIINGSDISKMEEGFLLSFVNENIGIVLGRRTPIMLNETVLENIKTRMAYKPENVDSEKQSGEILERFNLVKLQHIMAWMISGWEMMRLMVATAIASEPKVLLMDEILDSFNLADMEVLLNILLEYKKKNGAAIVMATHSEDIVRKADRVFVLRDGVMEELDFHSITNS